MTANAAHEAFAGGGRPWEARVRPVAGDRPLGFEADRLWVVHAGRVDVFATGVEGGECADARSHLFRVQEGGVLVGAAPAAGLAMLGVGAPGTAVRELSDDLETLLGAGEARATGFLEEWVRRLYEAMAVDARIPRHRIIEPGAGVEVDPLICVRPSQPVAWLALEAGSARLLGRGAATVRAGSLLPITRQAWVTTGELSTVRLLTTAELLAPDGPGAGAACRALAGLHALTLALVAERLRDEDAAQRERARRQERAQFSAMSAVIVRLAASMEPRRAARPQVREHARDSDEPESNSLYPAFRLVATACDIELGGVAASHEQVALKDPVQSLARSYRVRARRVALRDAWWSRDGEPILGRLADRPRVVALLPVQGRGYELVDPYERTRRRVDAAVAATLRPFGYTFYRPFGTEALRAATLLRFGLRGCGHDLVTVAAAGGLATLLGLVTPLVVAMLYDNVIPSAERGQLLQLTAALVVSALATGAFHLVRGVALLRIESRVGPRLQAALWDRLLALPLSFFRGYTAGELATRAMGIEEMRTIASGAVVTVLLGGVFSLANFVLLFTFDGRLAWTAVGAIALAVAVSAALGYAQVRRQRVILPLRSRTSGVVLQLLTGVPKLRVAGAEVHGFALWGRLFSEQRAHQYWARTLRNAQVVFSAVFPVLATLTLFYVVAMPQLAAQDAGVAAGATGGGQAAKTAASLTTGEFLAFLTAFNVALSAMLSSSAALVGALAMVPLYEQLRPILETTPEVHVGKRDPGELTGALELQHVTFRYQSQGPAVLHDMSIRVRPGEFVAFVGPSGSGKSTTLRLLLGFERPESGVVSYDGQDLDTLDLGAVRRQIGVVVQNGRLMAGDIFTNIVGSSAATLDDAWEAARMAGLDEDVRQMPMGMHTVISEGGGTLSGGQRQRLLIARALVRRPRLLYFDEATSALDNRTQDVVTRSLAKLKATRVVVAHRLSTIRDADRIYVIVSGAVVESGGFDELLARGGVFTELARRQLV